jgi:hypothetical protein
MKLFSPFEFGPFDLTHRIVMPPLTRMRASSDGVPSSLAPAYYGQRATEGGLIIAEATQISRQGHPQVRHRPHLASKPAVDGRIYPFIHGGQFVPTLFKHIYFGPVLLRAQDRDRRGTQWFARG